MRCIDFEYDGQLLSDHDCMICGIGNPPGVETVDFGNHVSLNTVRSIGTNKFYISSTGYDEPYTVSFQVAKLSPGMELAAPMDEYELSDMMRWLNRKNYYKFKPVYKDGECSDVYYMGTFDVQPVELCGRIIGLDLTLKTDAPFGYYEPVRVHMSLRNPEDRYTLVDSSDETGFTYPATVTIECLADGDLVLKNTKDARHTEIKNCRAGEMLTLAGFTMISTITLSGYTTGGKTGATIWTTSSLPPSPAMSRLYILPFVREESSDSVRTDCRSADEFYTHGRFYLP